MPGSNEKVAREDVSVMLDDKIGAAFVEKGAFRWRFSRIPEKQGFKKSD
jgi:hypothetical protein